MLSYSRIQNTTRVQPQPEATLPCAFRYCFSNVNRLFKSIALVCFRNRAVKSRRTEVVDCVYARASERGRWRKRADRSLKKSFGHTLAEVGLVQWVVRAVGHLERFNSSFALIAIAKGFRNQLC